MAWNSDKQFIGALRNARIEMGCVSASTDTVSHTIDSKLVIVKAGFGVAATNGASAKPVQTQGASVCEGGYVEFTVSDATAGPISYILVGW